MSEEEITVEVPMDVDGVVYIFRGPAAQVDERVDLWLSTEEPTWDEVRDMTAKDWEEVESYVMPETQPDPRDTEAYQHALLTQLDYDSTRTGRDALHSQIEAATDPTDSRALHARLIAGEAAHVMRRHMLNVMPATPERGSEAYTSWHRPLAAAREELAQHLALATAEIRAFTRPSPQTAANLAALAERAGRYAAAFGQCWWGPANGHGVAPWVAAPTRPAEARDAAVLWAMGVEATWDGERITAYGDLGPAWSYGYRTTRPGQDGAVTVVSVSDTQAWYKAQA